MPAGRLNQILTTLEACHGEQSARWPTDPYLFLIWWHCGYPPSEERCTRGWESLRRDVGVNPDELLAARSARIARALMAGGIVPELRATRLKAIAKRTRDEFGGDLGAGLATLPLAEARAQLKKFPGIGDPGADRILLFAGIAPLAAVPSNCAYVLVRVESGPESASYLRNYRESQQALLAQAPHTSEALTRAYLLIQRHGRTLCRRTNPRCDACPLAKSCAFPAQRRRQRKS